MSLSQMTEKSKWLKAKRQKFKKQVCIYVVKLSKIKPLNVKKPKAKMKKAKQVISQKRKKPNAKIGETESHRSKSQIVISQKDNQS